MLFMKKTIVYGIRNCYHEENMKFVKARHFIAARKGAFFDSFSYQLVPAAVPSFCCAFFLLPSATGFLFGKRNPPSQPFFCYTRFSFSVFMPFCRFFTQTASRPSALLVSCSSICSSGMKKDDTGMWTENAPMSMLSLDPLSHMLY